jgi:hypothetical protein
MYLVPRYWKFILEGEVDENRTDAELIKSELQVIAIKYGLELSVDNGTSKGREWIELGNPKTEDE